ncbi:hypothetical protein DRO48_01970 [Candidatus Bathyarchaeota archaeon]|nr:MAG: hypothetical protein DRO48_01970 [Candidatus Bathyarchaeota archaeon]
MSRLSLPRPAREGDLLETVDGALWDVKGLIHPPSRIVAFIRYVPDPEGSRIRRVDGRRYRKIYPIKDRYAFVEEHYPSYLVHDGVFGDLMCEVPVVDVARLYVPERRLQELLSGRFLSDVERDAVELAEAVKQSAGVPWSSMGICGSLLSGLYERGSDIDLIFYGSSTQRKVYEALKSLREEGVLRKYTRSELLKLYGFRFPDTRVPLDAFLKAEERKLLQGMFMGREYFFRFVKDWSEVDVSYGAVRFRPVGYGRIKAVVSDASEAFFTPCAYKLESVRILEGPEVPIVEVSSYRGRFCEQAWEGESIVAQGKVELVLREPQEPYYRLIVGGKPTDFLLPLL